MQLDHIVLSPSVSPTVNCGVLKFLLLVSRPRTRGGECGLPIRSLGSVQVEQGSSTARLEKLLAGDHGSLWIGDMLDDLPCSADIERSARLGHRSAVV